MMYLDEIADEIESRLSPDVLPSTGPSIHRLFRLYAVLVRAKGTAITDEDIHDAWSAWMADEDPAHSSLVPYAKLDPETRAGDRPFAEATRAVAARLAA